VISGWFAESDLRVNVSCDSLRNIVCVVAVCCSVLQCVAVCCSLLQLVAVCRNREKTKIRYVETCCSVLQFVAVCCSVLPSVAIEKNRVSRRCGDGSAGTHPQN